LTSPSAFRVDVAPHGETGALLYEADQPSSSRHESAFILAHGAGAGHRSAFIVAFARAMAALGVDVVTFNFLYTERGRPMPDRAPVLEACYTAVIGAVRDRVESAAHALFIGGKSMGGRIATQVAAASSDLPVAGLALLGYPLHPPGRPEQRRDAHLSAVGRPMLFVQGSRDVFGTPAELSPVVAKLNPSAVLHVVDGGDHSFELPRADAAAQAAVYDAVQRAVVEWMAAIIRT